MVPSIIISSPSPEWNTQDLRSCRQPQWFQTLNTNTTCKADRVSLEKEYSLILEFLDALEERHKNVYIFDTLSALCPNGICHYTIEGKELYRDRDHLSNHAMRKVIGPNLLDLISNVMQSRNQGIGR